MRYLHREGRAPSGSCPLCSPASDIDFLVQFDPGASVMDLVRLTDDLEAVLGCQVDVVSVGRLTDRDERIRREAVAV